MGRQRSSRCTRNQNLVIKQSKFTEFSQYQLQRHIQKIANHSN